MKQSVSFVTSAVHDFAKELAFRRETLDWQPFNVVRNTIAFFNVGSPVFSLCAYQELRGDVGIELTIQPASGGTLALNLPDEAVVDAVFVALTAAGATIVNPPVRPSWGGYSGYDADPEGNLWEVAYNPQLHYDATGTMIVPSHGVRNG